jgi:hypothetical protein
MRSKLNRITRVFLKINLISFDRLQIHQWSEATIKKVTRDKWEVKDGLTRKTVDMMVTPRVVEEVRRHFNCSELEGAELEDQGGEGTALTHWEKRVFEAEAMSGTHSSRPVFSRITLALMEGKLKLLLTNVGGRNRVYPAGKMIFLFNKIESYFKKKFS